MSEEPSKHSQTFKDTTFWGLLKQDPTEPFCLPFVISAFATASSGAYYFHTGDGLFIENILSEVNSLFAISISSLGLILAALALVLVIFTRKTMHFATLEGAFQQFLLPYYIAALSWTTLSLVSLFYLLFNNSVFLKENQKFNTLIGFTLLFFIIYSIFFTIRVVASIISNTLLAAFEDYDEDE